MNRYLHYFILIIILINAHPLFSQNCGTDYFYDLYNKKHPHLQTERDKFENIATYSHLNKKSDSIKIIPVVFHVIHQFGIQYISKSLIDDAIKQLNVDFRKMNADTSNIRSVFKPYAADCKIEFRLAKIDPNGNCTEGVNRVYSPLTYLANENVKSLTRWDNSKYLNIWVVSYILVNKDQTPGGYAQFPGPSGGPDSTDGIVINFTRIGLNKSTLSHEVGHWLGVFHTFQNPECNSTGDFVADTPPDNSNVETSCSTSPNSCSNYSLPYTSDPPDMIENYMDYSFENCYSMFTIGQKARMDATLSQYRSTIFSKENLAATGVDGTTPTNCPPIADFQANSQVACVGRGINFFDKSYNGTGFTTEWKFEKGSDSSSSLKNPVNISWGAPGKYLVSLTAFNTKGKSTKTVEITILPAQATEPPPFKLGYEVKDIPTEGIIIQDEGLFPTWERTSKSSKSGKMSMFIHHYSETTKDNYYSFLSKPFNLSSFAKPTLSFYVAHADRNTSIPDVLSVYYSTNCGATWTLRRNFTKATLSGNVLPINEDYFPVEKDWQLLELDLSTIPVKNNIQFMFESPGLRGNNIFIDDISIQNGSVAKDNSIVSPDFDFNIIPNPVSNDAQISLTLLRPATVNYVITNSLGQELLIVENQKLKSGENVLPINTNAIQQLAKGVYFIVISIDNSKQSKKFIKI